jgi:hypothetical protein
VACGCNRSVNYSVYSFVALTPLRENEKQPHPETNADKLKPVPGVSKFRAIGLGKRVAQALACESPAPEDKNGTNSTSGAPKDRARRRDS